MSATLRVLIVMPLGTALGGGEEMLRQLLNNSRGSRVEESRVDWTVVFLRDGPMVAEVQSLGIEAHVVEAGRFRELRRRAGAVRRIAALARDRNVDLVFGWMVAGQLMAGAAALLARKKCAWYQVGTPRPDWLDRAATLLPARGVLVLSRAGGEAQARVFPRRRQWLVHPGVALDAFDPARLPPPPVVRTALGLPAGGPIVGMVARLQRWKGVHVLIEAVPAIQRAHPQARVVIVGGAHETEPGYADELRARTRALGVENAVTFAGHQANVAAWMQAMDIVVHASDREPFGIVVIEAMALGKPVVAGSAGGPAEIITDGVDGELVPFGDHEALARVILRYLGDPALAARTGAAARKRAATFSDRAYATGVVRALREIAAG